MTLKIATCAGHAGFGVTPGKRSPNNEYEWHFNDEVVKAFIQEMNTYEDVQILRTDDPSGKRDIRLTDRTNKANKWGADYYISFHHNALHGYWGDWTGVETFYHAESSAGKELAQVVHPAVVKAYGLRDRGLKTNKLHITSKTKMPAVLIEGGFMDSTIDIKKLRNKTVLQNAGKLVAQSIAEWKGLKKKKGTTSKPQPSKSKPSSNTTKTIYRVRKSASDVKSQKGAFENLNNAKQLADKHTGYKVYDQNGKLIYTGSKKTTSSSKKTSSKKYTIPSGIIRNGDRGTRVKQLQEALNAANFKLGKADGIFGAKTLDALRRFQSVYANPVDGVYGPKTAKALDKVVN